MLVQPRECRNDKLKFSEMLTLTANYWKSVCRNVWKHRKKESKSIKKQYFNYILHYKKYNHPVHIYYYTSYDTDVSTRASLIWLRCRCSCCWSGTEFSSSVILYCYYYYYYFNIDRFRYAHIRIIRAQK